MILWRIVGKLFREDFKLAYRRQWFYTSALNGDDKRWCTCGSTAQVKAFRVRRDKEPDNEGPKNVEQQNSWGMDQWAWDLLVGTVAYECKLA